MTFLAALAGILLFSAVAGVTMAGLVVFFDED